MPTIDSAIKLESQTSTASVPIPGTDIELNYNSKRVRGRAASRTITVPLTGASPPDSLKRVELDIRIAGKRIHEEFPPDPSQTHTFTWDGRDRFGNRVQGSQRAVVELTYAYDGTYEQPAVERGSAFNNRSGITIEGSQSRDEIYLSTDYGVDLQYFDASLAGLAGWWISPHHVRNRHASAVSLLRGDGTTRTVNEASARRFDKPKGHRFNPGFDLSYSSWTTTAIAPDGTPTVAMTIYSSDAAEGVRIYDLPADGLDQLLAEDGDSIDVVGTLIADESDFDNVNDISYGSEGRLYVAGSGIPDGTQQYGTVNRISQDGSTISQFAGTDGQDGQHPVEAYDTFDAWITDIEGNLAAEEPLPFVSNIDIGRDGDTYIKTGLQSDTGWGGGIIRISPDGRLYRAYSFDTSNSAFFLTAIADTMAVGPSGNLYLAGLGRILRIDSQENAQIIAGLGSNDVRRTEDPDHLISASSATVGYVGAIDVDETGTVYFLDSPSNGNVTHLRKFTPGGLVRRVAGYGELEDIVNETETYRDEPANSVAFPNLFLWYLSIAPGNEIYLNGLYLGVSNQIFGRVGPSDSGATSRIPSRDGTELYEFQNGRHARTVDTLTGTTLYDFSYDSEGRLTSVTDRSGSVVQIERDADGTPSAIVAPTGQRLELTVTDDYITNITRPDGRQLDFSYGTGGLLETITHPSGNQTTFGYDVLGFVTSRTRPTGDTDMLDRVDIENGRRLVEMTAANRETRIDVERTGDGRRVTTRCCGSSSATETLISPGGQWTVTYPDGATKTTQSGDDPRFGGQSPFPASTTYTSPGGQSTTTDVSRSVTLADDTEPLSLTSLTETSTLNGRSYERSYDPSADQLTATTPADRTMTVDLDSGRATTISVDGMDGLSLSYGGSGRISGFGRTGSEATLEYDGNGNVSAVTDPAGRRSQLSLSAGEYPESFTTPAGYTTTFSYDDDGHLSSFTRPNGETHSYDFDAAGNMTGYTPPEGGTRSLSYDADGLPTQVSLPSGRTVSNDFGATTSLQEATHPDATVTYDRDAMDRLTTLTRSPADGSTDQTVSMTRDGELTTELAFSGPASGTFAYSHDGDGRISEITYPNGTTRSLSYDADGLLTAEGPFSIERNGPMGRPSRISDGTLEVAYSYDAQGRVASRTHTVDGTEFYAVEYSYDASDLLVERTETLPSGSRTETFSYDDDGRLTGVERDGSVVESYTYDENGNRTSREVDGNTEQASYQAGDRLVEQGSLTYGYDADGHVTDRGGDTLDYSATGELLEATLDSGTVSYTPDGYGRRVARTAPDGTTTEYLYGDPNDPTTVTAVREGGEWTHYHYDPSGHLYAFERGGSWYYVGADQVGTPRVVVDSSGSVVKEVDRDAYGAVRSDSAPDFTLHVGFAGGIPDPSTGLVRFGMRDYDPETGRWLARDPMLLVSGQFNFYSYIENDPVNAVDPTGLSWECFVEKMLENFDQTKEFADPIGQLLDKLGVDTGTDLSTKEIFKEGLKNYLKQRAKGKVKKAAAKAAGKQVLKSVSRGGYYNLALYGGMLVGSGIHAGIDQFFGQGPGEALFEMIHGPDGTLNPCEAREKGLIDEDCPEKALEDCC